MSKDLDFLTETRTEDVIGVAPGQGRDVLVHALHAAAQGYQITLQVEGSPEGALLEVFKGASFCQAFVVPLEQNLTGSFMLLLDGHDRNLTVRVSNPSKNQAWNGKVTLHATAFKEIDAITKLARLVDEKV